jgi:hypothetical protein
MKATRKSRRPRAVDPARSGTMGEPYGTPNRSYRGSSTVPRCEMRCGAGVVSCVDPGRGSKITTSQHSAASSHVLRAASLFPRYGSKASVTAVTHHVSPPVPGAPASGSSESCHIRQWGMRLHQGKHRGAAAIDGRRDRQADQSALATPQLHHRRRAAPRCPRGSIPCRSENDDALRPRANITRPARHLHRRYLRRRRKPLTTTLGGQRRSPT